MATPPSSSLLNSTSRNMNYDHRKYVNIGAVKYSNNHHQTKQHNTESGVVSGSGSASSLTSQRKNSGNHELINGASSSGVTSDGLGFPDDGLMDSFEARMLQEMKAEMEFERLNPKTAGTNSTDHATGRNRAAGATSTTSATTTTGTTSGRPVSASTDAKRKQKPQANGVREDMEDAKLTDYLDEANSPDMARRGSSGLQSPWSDDQQTTSEKYNFDAMTSSIEDTTTSQSKKAVIIQFLIIRPYFTCIVLFYNHYLVVVVYSSPHGYPVDSQQYIYDLYMAIYGYQCIYVNLNTQ